MDKDVSELVYDPASVMAEVGVLPLGHRLVVLPDPIEEKTASGIVITTSTRGRDEMAQIKGTVMSVGKGCWQDTTQRDWCVPGDRIVFGKYSGLPWQGHDGKSYRILNDLDVVGLIGDKNV